MMRALSDFRGPGGPEIRAMVSESDQTFANQIIRYGANLRGTHFYWTADWWIEIVSDKDAGGSRMMRASVVERRRSATTHTYTGDSGHWSLIYR